jgi:hypothetical protein
MGEAKLKPFVDTLIRFVRQKCGFAATQASQNQTPAGLAFPDIMPLRHQFLQKMWLELYLWAHSDAFAQRRAKMPHDQQVTTVAGDVILWFEAPIKLRDSVWSRRRARYSRET